MSRPTVTQIRSTLADVWYELLGHRPQAHSGFFDLGGSSMHLVMLTLAVDERFGVDLAIDDLFGEDFAFEENVTAVTRAIGVEEAAAETGGESR
ncbi:acyl carrier protein [Actinoplanes sp. KI2]|uniref:acyl carrier protein n=1 Tax=Actinoplanes sp. KI2 TaxID=2983315 RepID=UPI0021D58850|nr:acyl carrier protein [Actinoplanes sp. KI2]MCU7725985.1 acyl carrier protein [Actinoplanes sp. KI2]